jgi:hypothetical protein
MTNVLVLDPSDLDVSCHYSSKVELQACLHLSYQIINPQPLVASTFHLNLVYQLGPAPEPEMQQSTSMSDHGFQPYTRASISVNTILRSCKNPFGTSHDLRDTTSNLLSKLAALANRDY